MKRILVVLALLVVAASAFAVSGKIYMRYSMTGPLFSYWGDSRNNVDLWQGKDGTGFDVNTESMGITYRTRQSFAMPYGLFMTNIGDSEVGGTPQNLYATSPGFLEIRDIKAGNVAMSVGVAWWQMFGKNTTYSTNTNASLGTNSFGKATTYNRVYLEYKFAASIGDSIVIKQVDWEMMHFTYDYGFMANGKADSITNILRGGNSFMAHIPLRVMITMDRLNLDISPKFTFQSINYGDNAAGNHNVMNTMSQWRAGGTVAISYGLSDSMNIYVEPGFFFWTRSDYNTTQDWVTGFATNANTLRTITEFPIFAGLMVKVGPGIKLTLGYGLNFATTMAYDFVANTTNKTDTVHPRYAYYNFNWLAENLADYPTEFSYYGDSFMDFGFLTFGGDIAFAQNWTLGLKAGVGLNDKWSVWYYNLGTRGATTTTTPTTVSYDYGAQLFSFLNLMNYDNNMYIKYEDDKVAIKGTLFGGGTGSNPDNPGVTSSANALMGLFGYMDFTIKF